MPSYQNDPNTPIVITPCKNGFMLRTDGPGVQTSDIEVYPTLRALLKAIKRKYVPALNESRVARMLRQGVQETRAQMPGRITGAPTPQATEATQVTIGANALLEGAL